MALRSSLLVATFFSTPLTSFREEQLAEQDKILLVLSLTEVEVDVQCLLEMLSCLDHVVPLAPEDSELIVRRKPGGKSDPLLADLVTELEAGEQQLLADRRLLHLSS